MDPSYNNGVGSQVPQSSPQMLQQPIASGTGDVVLGGGAPEKKSRKGIVILIVLVVLLALVGGGFLLWRNGVFGGGTGNSQQQTSGLQEKYNSYVNYVLWGVESDGRPDLNAMEEATPYFESLNDDSLNAYVVKVNTKYEALKQAYDASGINNKIDITPLKVYFQDYPELKGGSEAMDNYLKVKEAYDITNEKIMENAKAAGCMKDNRIITGCYTMTEEERVNYIEKINALAGAQNELWSQASGALEEVYVELYGGNENEGAVQ